MKSQSILCLAATFFSLFTAPLVTGQEKWSSVEVPGTVEFEGYAWFRSWLKPHDTFFSAHERDLFAESVIFNIRGLAGAHEVFVNGKSIGKGGAFPPGFVDGREGNHRHKVPPGLLVKGEWNEFAIRVYHEPNSGPAGFVSEAPFIMNYFQECSFKGKWEFRQGDDLKWAQGSALKEKPATAAFEDFYESNRPLGEAEKLVHGEKLPPAESFSKMTAAEDLEVDLLLHEPLVAQPVYFSFDERGRLWVAQYRQYPYPAGLKMVSRDRYYRSHYDKVPPAPPNHDRGRDVISIHEDTDGDGVYDKHKVFQDGLNMCNSAIRGRGGAWVMHTPYLLFYPDEDFDDVPDGPPVVHLAGFGQEDTHSVANGLVWGMDGWLYGAQGSTATCHVTRPGVDPPDAKGVYFQGCMVWRYHPETRQFEIFSEGGGNNFGLELDGQGRLFTGNNGGDTRGFHFVQNGIHQMQGVTPNKFGPPRNPFSFGTLPKMTNDQPIQRFTHLAALVEGTALPEKYQTSFFAIDPLHNKVVASRRKPTGATFETFDIGKVLGSEDFAFRPVYIGNAPDGSIMVADMYEHYIAHGQHYQSQIDPTSGRIYRLRGKDMKLETDLDLTKKSGAELVELLDHPNRWHRHTAVRLLGERKDPATRAPLDKRIGAGNGVDALCALWARYQAFGLDDAIVRSGLGHKYAAVRWWTVRLLFESPETVSEEIFAAVLELAQKEPDLEVHSQLAGSARRLPAARALPLVRSVLSHEEDLEDTYVPLMCWWVLEAKADDSRDDLLALFDEPEFWNEPMVIEHILPRIMRRFAMRGRNRDLLDCALLLRKAPGKQHSAQLLAGFEEAYQGRAMTGLPKELVEALADSGSTSLVLQLRLGKPGAVPKALELLVDTKTDLPKRLEIARALGELRATDSISVLLGIAEGEGKTQSPPELRRAALVSLMTFDGDEIGKRVAALLPTLPETLQPSAFELLLSRASWTDILLTALEKGDGGIAPSLVPADAVQRLHSQSDPTLRQRITKIFPEPKPRSAEDFNRRIAEVESILSGVPGNPYAGEAIFMQRCAACHQLFFKGGAIGPDLTDYQRDTLDTMLISIVNPNAEIREGFEYVTVETTDGRVLSGFLADQDTQIVVLRGPAGEDIRIPRSEMKDMQPVGRSLMPEDLLEGLTDEQLRDFFAYLRISQPISQ